MHRQPPGFEAPGTAQGHTHDEGIAIMAKRYTGGNKGRTVPEGYLPNVYRPGDRLDSEPRDIVVDGVSHPVEHMDGMVFVDGYAVHKATGLTPAQLENLAHALQVVATYRREINR